ncbi:hypothetical protein HK099_002315, partial [Clydaea vesicula]
MELLNLAKFALQEMLQNFGKRFIFTDGDKINENLCKNSYNIEMLLDLLTDAVKFELTGEYLGDIISTLASRFDEINVLMDLTFFPYEVFLSLISHPEITIDSEYKLYTIISKYIFQKKLQNFQNFNSSTSTINNSSGNDIVTNPNPLKSSTQNLLHNSNSRGNSVQSLFSNNSELNLQCTNNVNNIAVNTCVNNKTDSKFHPYNSINYHPGLTVQQIQDLYSTLNWEKFSIQEFEEAINSNLVPEKILVKGLLRKVKSKEGVPMESIIPRPLTKARKKLNLKSFKFQETFDKNGVVYFLAKQKLLLSNGYLNLEEDDYFNYFNKKNQLNVGTVDFGDGFINPQVNKILKVVMSSILVGNVLNLTSRQKNPTCTRCENGSWISIDFGASIDFKVKSYTLQHGSGGDKFNLRSWVLEGSNDNLNWEIIIKHQDDPTLGGNYGTGSWFTCQELQDENHSQQNPNFSTVNGNFSSYTGNSKFWRWLRIRALGNYFVQIS